MARRTTYLLQEFGLEMSPDFAPSDLMRLRIHVVPALVLCLVSWSLCLAEHGATMMYTYIMGAINTVMHEYWAARQVT